MYFDSGGNFTYRITGAIIIEICIIVVTIALAIINTAEWTSGFFYLTMLSVVILNIANGVYQNSLYGLASKLPMKYSNAVVLGSNISGTLTSVVNIITIWASPDLRIAAIYYFVSALFVLLVCFDTYLAFPINVRIVLSLAGVCPYNCHHYSLASTEILSVPRAKRTNAAR